MDHSNENPPPYYDIPPNEKTPLLETPKKKRRTLVPFPCYTLDITDFPKITFIPNSVIDNDDRCRVV